MVSATMEGVVSVMVETKVCSSFGLQLDRSDSGKMSSEEEKREEVVESIYPEAS